MKKFLLFILFFIPFMVHAETTDITMKDLVLKKTEGYTEVLSDAEIVNNKIVLNLKMYEVGDSAEYQFIVENKSSKDYQLKSKDLVNSDSTMEYQIIGEDQSNVVEKNSEKKFLLTVSYKNEVERTLFKAGKYDFSSNSVFELKEHHLINPETGSLFVTLLFIIIFVSIGFIILKNNRIKNYLLLFLFLIPFSVLALDEYEIEIESNIMFGYVTPNPCTYDGELVQGAEYVNGQYTYRYMQDNSWGNWDDFEDDGWGMVLTNKESTDPVTTTMCTSINDKPIVSMSSMFYQSNTTSIDTSSFDTSHVVNMQAMFYECSGLTEIDVSQFDTSNLTKIEVMFSRCTNLTSLDLSSFDTSHVIEMGSLVGGCTSLEELDLSNWDFRAYQMPNNGLMMYLTNGGRAPLKFLNLANAILLPNCNYALGGLSHLEILVLDNVNTSFVTNMSSMFLGCSSLTELDLSSFDISNVSNFSDMFVNDTSLTTMYAKTQEIADIFNGLPSNPSNINFVVKS